MEPGHRDETTLSLFRRARAGDDAALNALAGRLRSRLLRWANGRLPIWTRGAIDTSDIVQDTLLRTLRRLDDFVPQHEGALQAYVREALANRIREEIRREARRPRSGEFDSAIPANDASPLETAIGRELLDRYETGLSGLEPEEREAIVLRVEMGEPYAAIASSLEKPSTDAARMLVNRALVKLAGFMGHER